MVDINNIQGDIIIFRLSLFLTILILTFSSPSLEAQDTNSQQLIMATLTSIDGKLTTLINDLSQTNQRISRIEEWKIITEVKLTEVEKKTLSQAAYLNKSVGIGFALLGIWAVFVFLAPRLKFRKGVTK